MKINRRSQLAASILVNAIYSMKNTKTTLISSMIAPFAYLLIVFFASKGALLQVSILGALIMTVVNAGLGIYSNLTHLKNDFKLQDMIVSSPASASVYLLGMALSVLVYEVPTITILSILALIFIHISLAAALTVSGVMLAAFVFSVSVGFFLSTMTKDVIQSWGFRSMLSSALYILPPVYYPITYIPIPYRYLAYLSPTTYAAEIAQNSIGYLHLPIGMVALGWLVLVAVSLLFLVIAIKKSKWVEV